MTNTTQTAAKKTTLTIVTDAGTFSRTTATAYTHIVLAGVNDETGTPTAGDTLGVVAYASRLPLALKRAHTARTLRFGWKKPGAALVYSDVRVYAVDGTRVQ